jgi:hypothetical protein
LFSALSAISDWHAARSVKCQGLILGRGTGMGRKSSTADNELARRYDGVDALCFLAALDA